MNEIHKDHEELVVVLDDQIQQERYIEFDEMRVIRQCTRDPLYGVAIDGDLVTIFRADHAPSTTALARQLRQTAAAYQEGDGGDTEAAEGIADGGHSLH